MAMDCEEREKGMPGSVATMRFFAEYPREGKYVNAWRSIPYPYVRQLSGSFQAALRHTPALLASMVRVWLEYGYSMAAVWQQYG